MTTAQQWKLVAVAANARVASQPERSTHETAGGIVSDLRVYPNPAQGQLHMRLPDGESAEVSLHDAVGRVVQQQLLPHSGPIDVSSLPKGIYLVKVSQGGIVETEKVLIQ